jgi:hypothetical protein
VLLDWIGCEALGNVKLPASNLVCEYGDLELERHGFKETDINIPEMRTYRILVHGPYL